MRCHENSLWQNFNHVHGLDLETFPPVVFRKASSNIMNSILSIVRINIASNKYFNWSLSIRCLFFAWWIILLWNGFSGRGEYWWMAVTTKSQFFIIIIFASSLFCHLWQTMPLSDLTEFLGLSLSTRILMAAIVTHHHIFLFIFRHILKLVIFCPINWIAACRLPANSL